MSALSGFFLDWAMLLIVGTVVTGVLAMLGRSA